MTVNALVDELDRKLTPPPEGARLAPLGAWKRSLHQAGKEYAREVRMGVRGILGSAEQFKQSWELLRQEVQAGHADEVQQLRDRFLRAFEERLAHLQEARQLVRFASQVATGELPEAQELEEEIATLDPMLRRLTERWRTRENLERLVAEGQDDDRIVKTPGVCGGDARIEGTRISVWGLEEWRRLGWSDARILGAYPQLKPGDVAAAWVYVAEHPDEIEEAIRENQEA